MPHAGSAALPIVLRGCSSSCHQAKITSARNEPNRVAQLHVSGLFADAHRRPEHPSWRTSQPRNTTLLTRAVSVPPPSVDDEPVCPYHSSSTRVESIPLLPSGAAPVKRALLDGQHLLRHGLDRRHDAIAVKFGTVGKDLQDHQLEGMVCKEGGRTAPGPALLGIDRERVIWVSHESGRRDSHLPTSRANRPGLVPHRGYVCPHSIARRPSLHPSRRRRCG